jgi:hypothetical protein
MTTVGTVAMASSFKRNRIINGNMLADQRNAGASVTPTNGSYTLDRWQCLASQASKFTVQQSTTAPTGFKNSLLVTSSSAYTAGASDYFTVSQAVEGYNISDLNFGTASAQTVTVSFWVRSSLTGTFGCSLISKYAAGGRYYLATYTINAANTWEQKTITVTGDTTGTWLTDNSAGLYVVFSLGAGSTFSGAAGSWSGTYAFSPTGAVSVVGTAGATFYVTGVQLEVGTKATPYEMQIYSDQLSQCYRYCFVAPANWFYAYGGSGSALVNFATTGYFPVPMRTTPTATGTISVSNCPTPGGPVLSAYMISYNSYNSTNGAAAFGNENNYTFAAEL